ncbi:hypothetical protein HYH02_008944 [Chlamydomonas schloesseri]|uniref:EfeO-type cupredoxin-like domain-containing protein n=1 Tax=Chlamydomonas schloesseri TaxID=2026947 RepID=A0A835WCX6_9CHLO|nr:hypothetical protein HYH02_008944 [Chlamydomonas schloesseri]|eukprot:KAG2445077.1 hypothetical protein HYH02_008944 [Chlamydomonas schloesseri]
MSTNGPEAKAELSSRRQALASIALMGSGAFLGSSNCMPANAALKDYLLPGQDEVIEVSMTLGSTDGKYVFQPNTLELTQGKIYKLKLNNPSTSTHYFTALEFASKIYTVLVLAGDPPAEVKGAISEVALKAGGSATWVLMPLKPGKYPLRCTVKGHTEGGMVGTIIVSKA